MLDETLPAELYPQSSFFKFPLVSELFFFFFLAPFMDSFRVSLARDLTTLGRCDLGVPDHLISSGTQ